LVAGAAGLAGVAAAGFGVAATGAFFSANNENDVLKVLTDII